MNRNVSGARTRYSTDFALAVQRGSLPPHVLARLPRSTRHGMRRRDFESMIGLDAMGAFDRRIRVANQLDAAPRLLEAVEMLLAINRVLKATIRKTRGYKRLLADSRERIARVVERYSHLRGKGGRHAKTKLLRMLGLSRQQFEYWMRTTRQCGSSVLDLCRKRHPFQLLDREVRAIADYVVRPEVKFWPLICIFYRMRFEGVLHCGRSTFYKYCRALGFTRRLTRWHKPPTHGVRASMPGEILHADVTYVQIEGGRKIAVLDVVDNRSRKLLASVATVDASALFNLKVLAGVVAENRALLTKPFDLIVDDGSENKGALAAWAQSNEDIVRLLVALKHITFSNSMAESIHRMLKRDYIRDHKFHSLESLQRFLDFARADYNARPHDVHDGLSPNAIFAGETAVTGRFAAEMKAARRARVLINRKFDCNRCSPTIVVD